MKRSKIDSGRRRNNSVSAEPDNPVPARPQAGPGTPEGWAGLVLKTILEQDFMGASALAEKAEALFEEDEFRRLFGSLAGASHAYQSWYQWWDFDLSVRDMRAAADLLEGSEPDSLNDLVRRYIKAEADGVKSEQEWMRFELADAVRFGHASKDGFDGIVNSLKRDAKSGSEYEYLSCLAYKSGLFQAGFVIYLEAYRRLVKQGVKARVQAQKVCRQLDVIGRQLRAGGAVSEAGELRVHQHSLRNYLQALEKTFGLGGVNFTWTYRTSFPRDSIQSMMEAFPASEGEAGEGGYRARGTLEGKISLPILGIGKSMLNDVFRGEIGNDSFEFLAFYFPSFEMVIGHLPETLTISPSVRFYASGVASIHFRVNEQGGTAHPLTVSQLQLLRLLGLPQTSGKPLRIDWLPPHDFATFTQAADALLNALRPVFDDNLKTPDRHALDEFYAGIEDMSGFPLDRAADERWFPYALVRVYEIISDGDASWQGYSQEMAALSRPIPESIDTLDVWRRSEYDPSANLAARLPSLGRETLLFITSDHVLMHMPQSADWVQAEYLDIIEFQLNILVATNSYLEELDREIRLLRETRHMLKAKEYTPEALKQFNRQRLQDINRINDLKSRLVTVRSLAHASRVTMFAEHCALLEAVGGAVNLSGAIQQAENLAATLMGIEEDWDYIGRLLYQEQTEQTERKRTKFENTLGFVLQLIGITQIISSVVDIVTVNSNDQIVIPWLTNHPWIFSGSALKIAGLITFILGVVLIILARVVVLRRPKRS